MESAISHPKTSAPWFRASAPEIGAFRPSVSIGQRRNNLLRNGKLRVNKCAKGDSAVAADEGELEVEEELKKVSPRCRGVGGIVELMECLEREAIMGEDEGREASDYNRRALIFDRSSRVFQALKQKSQSQTATSASASPSPV